MRTRNTFVAAARLAVAVRLAVTARLAASACLAAVAVAIATPATARAQDVGLELGTVAPAAAVQTLDGKPADLARYVGKTPVLLEFWATWCENCHALEPQIRQLHARYGKQMAFVGVAVSVNQSIGRVKAYVAKYGIPGDQYYDPRGAASGAYDAPATSYIVILDRDGKVVYTGVGGDQKLEPAIRKLLGA